jgi:hypothetical protein
LRAKGFDDAAVFAGDGLDGRHVLQVLALGVVDQGNGGRRHARQQGNFARVVHAHLDNRGLMRGAQAQQSQWHPDVVVEVALGGQRTLALPGSQDRCDHLCHRGFAIAARHRDQWQAELLAPPGCQSAQRSLGVGNDHAGQTSLGKQILRSGLAEGGNCALARGLGQELPPVEPFTAQRDKEVTRLQRAGIGMDT